MDGERAWGDVAARFADWQRVDRQREVFLEIVSCNLTAEIAALAEAARAWAVAGGGPSALADQACVVLADAVMLGYLLGHPD
jgi:hypothetical protein